MKKLIMLVLLCSFTGCCTYRKSVQEDRGIKQEKVNSEFKKCLSNEIWVTAKFWITLGAL